MNGRKLPLEGAVNFRDLGGYVAEDGRLVKWGLLYRSDSLAELSDADQVVVSALGLRSLFDLRDESERQERPNRLSADAVPFVHAIGFFPKGAPELMDGVRERSLSVPRARELLMVMYRSLPLDHTSSYSRLLQTLLLPDALPALMHCTSGKDRTGFGSAVVMLALGVSRESILEDYLLTNQYRRDISFMVGRHVDPLVLDEVKAARPEFLAAAFGVIDAHWGGTAEFLAKGLGFSPAMQQRLQALLLAPCDPGSV